MSERKSPATDLAHTLLFAAVASLSVARSAHAQSAAPAAQPAQAAQSTRSAADPLRAIEPRTRRLSNGVTVVSATVGGAGAATVLAVPAGSARGEGGDVLAQLVARQHGLERTRCERAGLASSVVSDRAWVEFVTRAPAPAIELALWREASRLDVLAATEPAPLRAAHRASFDPSHAVLVVVSALDSAALDAMIDRTVGRIPSRATAMPTVAVASDPPSGWRRSEDGSWSRAWSIVGDRTPDHYAIELISWAMAEGRRALLPTYFAERTVRGAVIVDSFVDHELERDRLHLELRYASAQGTRPALDSLADDLLTRIAREGITGAELARARERWRVEWRAGESSAERLALRWARFEARFGNARLALTEEDRYDAVTVQDVLRVMNQQIIGPVRSARPASAEASR